MQAAGTTAGSSNEKFVLEGKVYNKKGNKYYRAKLTGNGEVLYEEKGEISKSAFRKAPESRSFFFCEQLMIILPFHRLWLHLIHSSFDG